MKYDNDKQDSDNNKYGRQQNLPGDDAHDTSQKHPHSTGDGQVQPENEKDRAQNREESQNKSEESKNSGGSTHPDHKKDTQTDLSEDPTRKNEANQGASDLRTRERTSFRREGTSEDES